MEKLPFEKKRPQAIERIAEAASNLLMPPLTPLHQTFMDQKLGVQEKRSELLRKQDECRNEGYAAAMRLMMPSAEQFQATRGSYLELIHKQRGNKDEQIR